MNWIIIETNKDVILDNPGARYRIVRAANVRIKQAVSIDARRSVIRGNLNAYRAEIGDDLDTQEAEIAGYLDACSAMIGGNLDISGAEIGGDFDTRVATICGNLYVQGAKIGGNLDIRKSVIGVKLDAEEAWIGGDFDAYNATICGNINISGAEIGVGVDIQWTNIGGNLDARGAKIGDVRVGEPSEEEIALVQQILGKGDRLRMEAWHSKCGTAHCLAGWAQVFSGREEDPESALADGREILPSFSHLFLASDRVARKECERLISEKRKDEEQDHENSHIHQRRIRHGRAHQR